MCLRAPAHTQHVKFADARSSSVKSLTDSLQLVPERSARGGGLKPLASQLVMGDRARFALEVRDQNGEPLKDGREGLQVCVDFPSLIASDSSSPLLLTWLCCVSRWITVQGHAVGRDLQELFDQGLDQAHHVSVCLLAPSILSPPSTLTPSSDSSLYFDDAQLEHCSRLSHDDCPGAFRFLKPALLLRIDG